MSTDRPILVGYDGSDQAIDALSLGRLMKRATGAPLILANVYPGRPSAGGGQAKAQGRFNRLPREAERVLAWAPVDGLASLRAVSSLWPHRGLRDLAQATNAAMIVLGSTHRGKRGLIEPGSTGEHLLRGAPCAVAVAPVGYAMEAAHRPARIAVGYDGSDESRTALDVAIALARAGNSELRIVTVFELIPELRAKRDTEEDLDFLTAFREEQHERLDEALRSAPDDVRAEGVFVEGYPADVLRDQEDVELVVLGSAGFGRLKAAILGSVSAKVVHGGKAPVLIVPVDAEFLSGLSGRTVLQATTDS